MASFLRSTARISLAVSAGMALYFFATFASLVCAGRFTTQKTADAIVVMGAAQYDGVPSKMLERRLQHALQLFNDARAPVIAVTGGKKQGDRFTEAATSRRWLTDRGVPRSGIIMESSGSSTWESLSNLAPVLHEANIHNVLVSTDQWHVQRSVLSLRELGFSATASPISNNWFADISRSPVKYVKETIGVSVGRLLGFKTLLSITG